MHTLINLTDGELIDLIKKNDESAIGQLLHRYKGKLYTAVYLLTKDRCLAEDIFQDTFIKIVQSIRNGKYSEEGKFLPWSLRIARNLAVDHLRIRNRSFKITLNDGSDIFTVLDFKESTIEEKTIQKQSSNRIRKMLDLIPFEQREVIVLRLYGEMSFKEIARLTDVSVNTALGRMRYGLLSLRKIADEKGILL